MAFVAVGKVDEVPKGEGRTFEVAAGAVAVFHTDNGFYCLDNTCCHRGGPLGVGHLDGVKVMCPWHAWEFDVTTGVCAEVPGAEVPTYPIKVEDGQLWVDLPAHDG